VTISPRLRCERIRKSFPGVLALDEVTLEVAPGSIHALVGANGAGKSTLVKVLSGALPPDGGTIEIDGRRISIANARESQRLGIAVVYQEFSLVPDLSVSENVFLGRWPRSRLTGCVRFPELHRSATAVLETLGIALPVRSPARALSVAQRQMVEIARALTLEARILILDEPSAVLTAHELATLFEIVRQLAQRGTSVIYISHRLDEIFAVADSVTVLRDGRHVSTRPTRDLSRAALIKEMVGVDVAQEFPARTPFPGDVVLQVLGLQIPPARRPISFDVHRGEVFALTGLVGSGRSSLARAIFGARPAAGGRLIVGLRAGPFRNPAQAMAAGIAMLPEDRKEDGLLLQRSVRENITLANRLIAARYGLISPPRERAFAADQMRSLRIKAKDTESPIATLSGGNQQKVMLARWMSRDPRVLILDEPTRGVDVGAKFEIYTLINRLADRGAAVVLVSSELPEVIALGDRIGVMRDSALVGILDNPGHNVSQETIMHLAAGERGQP